MNGKIILCKGIKLDRNYENVLSYDQDDMLDLCEDNAVYIGYTYTIIPRERNVVRVSCPYKDAIFCNYMAFINPDYENQYCFAFIDSVNYIDDGTVEVRFTIDVFSTWYYKFNVGQAFIEREHVSNDSVGANLVPENLETGEYIAQNLNSDSSLQDLSIIVASSLDLDEFAHDTSSRVYTTGIYQNLPTGCAYYKFSIAYFRDQLGNILYNLAQEGLSDNIICMFLAPSELCTTIDANHFRLANSIVPVTKNYGISKITNLDTYVPKNNKCLTFPYCFINLTNGMGQSGVYKQEYWDEDSTDHEMKLIGKAVINPGCSIRIAPVNYKGKAVNFDESISIGKYPQLSWANDLYTNWMTQNGVNLGFTTLNAHDWTVSKALIQSGVGVIQAGTGASESALENAIGGLGSVFNQMQEEYRHSFVPYQVEGSLNSGDVSTVAGYNTFSFSRMTITREFAKKIDDYFNAFGYRVNEFKTPNLNSRTIFNYVKIGVGSDLIDGDIPSRDLLLINDIFKKGVRIYHSYSNIGNVTINNPIA